MTALIPRRARRSKPGLVASIAEALLTPHGIDRYLELVNPMLVRNEIRGEVMRVRRQTADTLTLSLWTSKAWKGFQAGQYVRVGVDIDGVRRTRCYSPANSQYAADGTLELTIKVDPNGLVSRYLFENAHVGMVLGISQPDGDFTLPERRPRRIVLVSGGSGITPVLSMLRTLHEERYSGHITFVHYANTASDVLYRAELERLAEENPCVKLVFAYTHESSGADLHGFFDKSHLDKVAPWWREAQTFLCGPPGLMDSVREAFDSEDLGERLHTEVFTPPEIAVDTEGATGQVRFAHSGREAANSGKTLLEQAEEAGLKPEHGCRMGICFSCTAVKNTGCVRNALTGELSSDPDQEIQLCISVPVGDVDINC